MVAFVTYRHFTTFWSAITAEGTITASVDRFGMVAFGSLHERLAIAGKDERRYNTYNRIVFDIWFDSSESGYDVCIPIWPSPMLNS